MARETKAVLVILPLLILLSVRISSLGVSAWSMIDRRKLLLSIAALGVVKGDAVVANAACLPGDLSPECIGVYKVPIDENIKGMVSTKESLKKYAPDLNYVPPIVSPKSVKAAMEALQAQRKAADDVRDVVAAGRLEEAGIKVLNLIPKMEVSGRMLVETLLTMESKGTSDTIQQLREQQLKAQLETAVVAWKNVDVAIGQGLRGNMGVSAVAQIQILSEIKEAIAALDDFLVAVQKLQQ